MLLSCGPKSLPFPSLSHLMSSRGTARGVRGYSQRRGSGTTRSAYSKPRDVTVQRCLFRQSQAPGARPVRLVSFNVLADELLYQHLYLYQSYRNAQLPRNKQPYYFEWEYRQELLLTQLLGPRRGTTRIPDIFGHLRFIEKQLIRPDIICLQEVDHYNSLEAELASEGYSGLFLKRSGKRTDGCALFFKKLEWNLEASHLLEFNRQDPAAGSLHSDRLDHTYPLISSLHAQTPLRVAVSINEGAESYSCHVESKGKAMKEVLDRDNVAIIALLRSTADPSKVICVATTHLLYNPRRGDVRILQADLLLHEVASFLLSRDLTPATTPLVVCGDFNSAPNSALYDYMSKNSVTIHPGNPQWAESLAGTHSELPPAKFVDSVETLQAALNANPQREGGELKYPKEAYFLTSALPEEITAERFSHPLRLASAYAANGKEPFCTTCHRKARETVDYLWYSPDTINKIQTLQVSHLGADELSKIVLPHRLHPSDHLMLGLEMSI